MSNSKNPNNNSILQALLDARDVGVPGLDGAIAKISGDRKLQQTLQKKWNAHAYPERDMVYTQLTSNPALMQLSPRACKILIFLGCYCAQSTLIKVSLPVLETATGIKRTKLREALQELLTCGVIRVHKSPARHEAPIYAVDPAVINKGVRRRSKEQEYLALLTHRGFQIQSHLYSTYTPALDIKCDTVKSKDDDSNPLYYNEISLVPATKKAPEPADTDPRASAKKRTSSVPESTTSDAPGQSSNTGQIPGQIDISDFMSSPDLEDFLPK